MGRVLVIWVVLNWPWSTNLLEFEPGVGRAVAARTERVEYGIQPHDRAGDVAVIVEEILVVEVVLRCWYSGTPVEIDLAACDPWPRATLRPVPMNCSLMLTRRPSPDRWPWSPPSGDAVLRRPGPRRPYRAGRRHSAPGSGRKL